VRFNGGYSSRSKTTYYFNFDSWRTNAGKDIWLPSFIYSEEADNPLIQSFRAQTRCGATHPLKIGRNRN